MPIFLFIFYVAFCSSVWSVSLVDLVICNCLFTFTFVGLPSSVGLQFIIIIIS